MLEWDGMENMESITNWLSEDIEYSDDWISYPNQFDMLSDYTGWVDRGNGEAKHT